MSANVDTQKVMRELKRLAERVPDEVEKEVGVACEHVVSEMKQEGVVPRDTGRLRDSHGWERLRKGVWRLSCNTSYAAAVHETHTTKGGWFRRTFTEQMPRALERALKVVKQRTGM